MSPPAVIVNLQNAAECFEVKGRSLGLAVGGPITDEIAEFGWGIGRPFRWRPTTKKTSTRPDSVAGLRGLELANVIFGKPLEYWPNSLWFQRTLCDLRPFAHELHQTSWK